MRVPSGTARKFPTQKPSIDKVAEHIDDVVTVAESIDSGQFDKVSIPEVSAVAGIHKQVVQVAEVEQYVRMLALDLGNIAEVARATTQVGIARSEADRAKSQADRAKAEADRASQISGLSTVSDAIGLASLPLPDVWAPLTVVVETPQYVWASDPASM